jgi:hypothetical protein
MAIAENDDVVFGGASQSSDFPATSSTLSGGTSQYSAFLGRINPALDQLSFLELYGGSGDDAFRGVAVNTTPGDYYGDVAYTGTTSSNDFPEVAADGDLVRSQGALDQAVVVVRLRPAVSSPR